MLSTSSYSKTLIKENFSRYWAVPVFGLIGLFLTGMLPVLMGYRNFRMVSNHAETVMRGSSISVNAVILMLAVTSAVLVFSYLHEQVSSTAMHAMPVDRKKLFGSAVISGWVLTVLPIIVFALLMLTLRGATTAPGAAEIDYKVTSWMTEPIEAKEIYTLPHALEFLVISVVTASFGYALFCLAAVLSGRMTIHALLAPFLFQLPNTIAEMASSLCEGYLFGFKTLNIRYDYLNAMSYAITKEDFGLEPVYIIYYIALSLAILAISMWVYSKIKLERIGNATTFPIVGDVLAGLLTVICSIGFANLFVLMTSSTSRENPSRFIISVLISSIVFYAIMRMIADSSFLVFNKRSLKQYAICLAIIAAITSVTVLDITGYGKRVPDPSEVASVHLDTSFPDGIFSISEELSDPATIESLAELQQAVIDEKNVEKKRDAAGYEEYSTEELDLVWKLKNGKEISRRYEVIKEENHVKTAAALKKLIDTPGYRTLLRIDAKKEMESCKTISIYESFSEDEPEEIYIKKEDWQGLLEAIDKDLSGISYEQLAEYVEWEEEDGKTDTGYVVDLTYKENVKYGGKSYNIRERDKNTIEYLKTKGYIK